MTDVMTTTNSTADIRPVVVLVVIMIIMILVTAMSAEVEMDVEVDVDVVEHLVMAYEVIKVTTTTATVDRS